MSLEFYVTVFSVITAIISVVSFILTPHILKKDCLEQVKIDISMRQMKKAEERIAHFLNDNNLPIGSSVYEIAKVLHIVDGGISNGISGRARLCLPDKNGNMTVQFKRGLSKEEYKFDFAHECAHQINGDAPPNTRPGGRNKPKVEQIADYTAAALLMPLAQVYDYLVENDYSNADKDKRYSLIRGLCKKYEVSEIIALRRVKEVNELKNMKMKL